MAPESLRHGTAPPTGAGASVRSLMALAREGVPSLSTGTGTADSFFMVGTYYLVLVLVSRYGAFKELTFTHGTVACVRYESFGLLFKK